MLSFSFAVKTSSLIEVISTVKGCAMLTSIIVQIAIAALIAVWVFTLCVKMLTKAGIKKDK